MAGVPFRYRSILFPQPYSRFFVISVLLDAVFGDCRAMRLLGSDFTVQARSGPQYPWRHPQILLFWVYVA